MDSTIKSNIRRPASKTKGRRIRRRKDMKNKFADFVLVGMTPNLQGRKRLLGEFYKLRHDRQQTKMEFIREWYKKYYIYLSSYEDDTFEMFLQRELRPKWPMPLSAYDSNSDYEGEDDA